MYLIGNTPDHSSLILTHPIILYSSALDGNHNLSICVFLESSFQLGRPCLHMVYVDGVSCLHMVYVDAVSCLHMVYVDATACLHMVQVICYLVIT